MMAARVGASVAVGPTRKGRRDGEIIELSRSTHPVKVIAYTTRMTAWNLQRNHNGWNSTCAFRFMTPMSNAAERDRKASFIVSDQDNANFLATYVLAYCFVGYS